MAFPNIFFPLSSNSLRAFAERAIWYGWRKKDKAAAVLLTKYVLNTFNIYFNRANSF